MVDWTNLIVWLSILLFTILIWALALISLWSLIPQVSGLIQSLQ